MYQSLALVHGEQPEVQDKHHGEWEDDQCALVQHMVKVVGNESHDVQDIYASKGTMVLALAKDQEGQYDAQRALVQQHRKRVLVKVVRNEPHNGQDIHSPMGTMALALVMD